MYRRAQSLSAREIYLSDNAKPKKFTTSYTREVHANQKNRSNDEDNKSTPGLLLPYTALQEHSGATRQPLLFCARQLLSATPVFPSGAQPDCRGFLIGKEKGEEDDCICSPKLTDKKRVLRTNLSQEIASYTTEVICTDRVYFHVPEPCQDRCRARPPAEAWTTPQGRDRHPRPSRTSARRGGRRYRCRYHDWSRRGFRASECPPGLSPCASMGWV